jgi:hypothetical protein
MCGNESGFYRTGSSAWGRASKAGGTGLTPGDRAIWAPGIQWLSQDAGSVVALRKGPAQRNGACMNEAMRKWGHLDDCDSLVTDESKRSHFCAG